MLSTNKLLSKKGTRLSENNCTTPVKGKKPFVSGRDARAGGIVRPSEWRAEGAGAGRAGNTAQHHHKLNK